MGFCAILKQIEQVHKLHERSECNLLNEFNLFRIDRSPFNFCMMTYVYCFSCLHDFFSCLLCHI